MLEVRSAGSSAGRLNRTAQQKFAFTYLADAPAEAAVSLTMPVRPESWLSMWGIHPIFQMNLPEGALRLHLATLLAKALPDFDDLELLRVTGWSQIGRLSYGTPGDSPGEAPQPVSVEEILTYDGAEDLFRELLERFAPTSGISGVQPKVLIRSEEGRKLSPDHKVSLQAPSHVVKTWDAAYPELALNEHFCLLAAAHAGLTVPVWEVSENSRFLVVERFDLDEAGNYLGFEDLCVLSGVGTDGKYKGSYEQIAKTLKEFIEPGVLGQALRDYFKMVALAVGLRNGDAHRKNFGLLYASPVSRQGILAPAFDQVTTTAYLLNDVMALTLKGSKKWPNRKSLISFAVEACGLAPSMAAKALEEVENGILHAREALREKVQAGDSFSTVGNLMLAAWDQGLAALAA